MRESISNYWRSHLLKAFALSVLPLIASLTLATVIIVPPVPAQAKTPGSTYCFYGKCHRVRTLSQTRALIGKPKTLHTSHYSDCKRDRYNPCGLTSSGERFHPGRADNAASPIYPDGTILLVWNKANKAAVVMRINNAGPYWGNRLLDVSHAAATKLGFAKRGVAKLQTKIIAAPSRAESRYRRHRNYRRVPGYIGKHNSLADAERTTVAIMVLEAMAGTTNAFAVGGVVSAARFETKNAQSQRVRVALLAKEATDAMHQAELMSPILVASNDQPDAHLRPVTGITPGGEVQTRELDAPVVLAQAATSAPLDPAPSARPLVSDHAEILKLARPALPLVRTADVGEASTMNPIGRGRFELRFKISSAHDILSRRDYVTDLLPQRQPGIPGQHFPDQDKAIRTGIRPT